MSDSDSIAMLIERIREGNEDAARVVWRAFFPRVAQIARQLADLPDSAFDSSQLRCADTLSFARTTVRMDDAQRNDNDLWQVLTAVTLKSIEAVLRAAAASPGDAQRRGELPSQLASLVVDECRRLIRMLPSKLRTVALSRLRGSSVTAIADEQQVHVTSIERRLKIIRKTWEQAAHVEED